MKNIPFNIMVINWKWNKELQYPHFQYGNKEQLLEKLATCRFIPVHTELKKKEKIPAFVVPTNISLNHSEDGQLEDLTRGYIDHIINKSRENLISNGLSNENQAHHFLFLLHRGEGFEETGKLFDFIENEHSIIRNQDILRFNFFGGGRGTIYGEDGLLSHGVSTFRFVADSKAAEFDIVNGIPKAKTIKDKNFDHVWNYYWYQTRNKIEKLRKDIVDIITAHYAGLNSASTQALVETAKHKAADLLYRFDEQKYARFIDAKDKRNDGWTFSECMDLDRVMGMNNKNLADTSRIGLLNELEAFATGKTIEAFSNLTQLFDDLLASWQASEKEI